MRLRSILSEPLLHFVLIGSALFGYAEWSSGSLTASQNKIVLSAGQIEQLVAGFVKTWKRQPTDSELKGLIDDWVREEIAVQTAMLTGLDRGDVVIRRRLRQKFEFFIADAGESAAPTEEVLKNWFAANSAQYRAEPKLAFQHVYFSRQRRGSSVAEDAAQILKRFAAEDVKDQTADFGDPSMLPRELGPAAGREIDEMFGSGFAEAISGGPIDRWFGPIESAYGSHLVRLHSRVEASLPDFTAVRTAVERDYLMDRRQRQLDGAYEALSKKYSVVVEAPGGARPGKVETGR